jgi:hypothetical protein
MFLRNPRHTGYHIILLGWPKGYLFIHPLQGDQDILHLWAKGLVRIGVLFFSNKATKGILM